MKRITLLLSILFAISHANEPKIEKLHILSQVRSRFATVLVTSVLTNTQNRSQEAAFTVSLPNQAFISNFSMQIGGKIIFGEVKEKEQAQKAYESAKNRGQSAGQVKQNAREQNRFDIMVNVGPNESVLFNLTYQELLRREHGLYKHYVNLGVKQIVPDLKVRFELSENRKITQLLTPKPEKRLSDKTNKELKKTLQKQTLDENSFTIVRQHDTALSKATVTYAPSVDEQAQMKNEDGSITTQIGVLYDVQRDESAGEIEVVDGYFVHFFAPANQSTLPKRVSFVIDISGSMQGAKLQQTKDAMKIILHDLNERDKFNIAIFDDEIVNWKSEFVSANPQNVYKAIDFVSNLKDDGGTDINLALTSTLELFKTENDRKFDSIIFLTDGEATSGETETDQILKNIQLSVDDLRNDVIVHTISFGDGADYDLLKLIAQQHNGLARKIYEDSDASLQMEGFYSEIGSPLLANVKINYLDDAVDAGSIVRDLDNYAYYRGGEMVSVGRLTDRASTLSTEVVAVGNDGDAQLSSTSITLDKEPDHRKGFIERMWAYLTIKKILDELKFSRKIDMQQKEDLKRQALGLSLKYNFVTELTSMVVIQEDVSVTPAPNVNDDDDQDTTLHRTSVAQPSKFEYLDQDELDFFADEPAPILQEEQMEPDTNVENSPIDDILAEGATEKEREIESNNSLAIIDDLVAPLMLKPFELLARLTSICGSHEMELLRHDNGTAFACDDAQNATQCPEPYNCIKSQLHKTLFFCCANQTDIYAF